MPPKLQDIPVEKRMRSEEEVNLLYERGSTFVLGIVVLFIGIYFGSTDKMSVAWSVVVSIVGVMLLWWSFCCVRLPPRDNSDV